MNDLEILDNTLYIAIADKIYKETTSESWTIAYTYSGAYFPNIFASNGNLFLTLPWAIEEWNPTTGRVNYYTDANLISNSKEITFNHITTSSKSILSF